MDEQLQLIPDKPINPKLRKVVLDEIPDNLPGQAPGKAFGICRALRRPSTYRPD